MPLLAEDFNIEFVDRTRRFLDKTVKLLLRIKRAKGDLFHVNYALQDAWLTNVLKHLDVLHLHGSDIRSTLHTKKLGWIVKRNIEHAEKVLYATPDMEREVKGLRDDAEYIPTPIRLDLFPVKKEWSEHPGVVCFNLPYEKPQEELARLIRKAGYSLRFLDRNIPLGLMPILLSSYDIFVDRFTIPSLSKTCLEAMSCGLASIDYRHAGNLEDIVFRLSSSKVCRRIGLENRRYVEKFHNAEQVALGLGAIWREAIEKKN